MALDIIHNVESYIRDIAKDRRCRLEENFLEYDHMRSGSVTVGQFFRVLRNLLGTAVDADVERYLINKYGHNVGKEMDWRKFASDINGTFDVNDFNTHPCCKVLKTIDSPYVGSGAYHALPGDESFDDLRPTLSRINQFIKYRGITIRECYKQFDVHNVGLVTESQFYRFFPGPSDISESELTALVERYRSNKSKGFIDYLTFVRDLETVEALETQSRLGLPKTSERGAETLVSGAQKTHQVPSVNMILDRIRFAVHRRGIRIMDFFVDYDRLNHDAVTEHQFRCALFLAAGREAQLNREEVQALINNFRKPSDPQFISYREFCRQVDSPFHTLDLEKDPLKQPQMPAVGMLSRALPVLDTEEEQRVSKLLDDIRSKIKENRIPTYGYFRDFDLGTGITRLVSWSQFARVLHFLGLSVSTEDCKKLCRKFADPTTGEVNYAAFCQAVDDTFISQRWIGIEENDKSVLPTSEDQKPPAIGDSRCGRKASRRDWSLDCEYSLKTAGDQSTLEELLDRIRHLVLTNRLQLKPWFNDFDKLRCGYVTQSQFVRCLTSSGVSRQHLHDLTPKQLEVLLAHYSSPNDPSMINWVRFVEDVDSVFTLPQLEKHPLVRVMPQETFVQPKPGTADWSSATAEMRENYETSMATLRRKVQERRMLLLPDFVAFDKFHRGYVSPNNFRQLVTMFDFTVSPEGIDAILARHSNDHGFDYRGFLAELEPPPKEELEYRYLKRLEELQQTNIQGKQRRETEPVIRDAEGVLDKIKAEVYRRRIRLFDWFRDHDNLNHGYMPRTTFRRCVGVLPLTLPETEMSVIEDRFRGSEPGTIDWRRFCGEIESIFQTPSLETNPQLEPTTYAPDSTVAQNILTVDVAKAADSALMKIADRVRQRRPQLLPMFHDFDETHRLTVSHNQFRRVLTTLDLTNTLTEWEWSCLFRKYRHPMGVVDNVNYQAFIDDIYTLAGMSPRIP